MASSDRRNLGRTGLATVSIKTSAGGFWSEHDWCAIGFETLIWEKASNFQDLEPWKLDTLWLEVL